MKCVLQALLFLLSFSRHPWNKFSHKPSGQVPGASQRPPLLTSLPENRPPSVPCLKLPSPRCNLSQWLSENGLYQLINSKLGCSILSDLKRVSACRWGSLPYSTTLSPDESSQAHYIDGLHLKQTRFSQNWHERKDADTPSLPDPSP